jgi:hypothetical protein
MTDPESCAPCAAPGDLPQASPSRLVHPVHVALLAAMAGFFLYVNMKTPLAGEDFAHVPWPLGAAPSGLGPQVRTTVSAMLAQGAGWAWRIGELLAVGFGAFPKDVFDFANAAVLTGLVVVLFVTGIGRLPDWRRPSDAFPLLVLCAALLASLPVLGSLFFWPAGALNHTWALFLLLCYAAPFRLLAAGRDVFERTSAPLVALYCAAGIPAGMTVESAGPVAVAWAVLLAVWKRRSLPRWVPWAIASLAAGTALLLFAPSTTARRALYGALIPGDGTSGVTLYAHRLATVLTDHLRLAKGLLRLSAALAVCWAVAHGRPLLAALRARRAHEPSLRDAAVVGVMTVVSLGSVLALGTIPYHSDQIRGAALHWYVLFAAVAFLAGGVWTRLPASLRAAAVAVVVIVLGREMVRISRAYAAYHEEASARHYDILQQRREGIRDVSVDVLLTGTTRLVDTREQWSTQAEGPVFIARYYGVGSFTVGGARKAASTSEAPRGGRLLHGIDSARVEGGVLAVSGWALLESADAAAQRRYVVLRPAAGGAAGGPNLLLGTSPVMRADVAQAYGRADYARAGFEAHVETATLPRGEYAVGVLVVDEGASGMQVGGSKVRL